MGLRIIKRCLWKAIAPKASIRLHVPDKITVHHQGGEEGYPNIHQIPCFDGNATIRMLQKHDIYAKGLMDISVHFIISPNGVIYEGRNMNRTGAHTKSNHDGNIGIKFIGNFNIEKPTENQLNSFHELMMFINKQYPLIKFPKALYSHKEFNFTSCPGKYLHDIIMKIKYGGIPLEIKK